MCRAWSFGRNRTGLAHHTIPFAGVMVLLPFIPTVTGLAVEIMAGSIHPQLSPPGRNDLCAKSKCLWHHGSYGVAFRFILYSQRLCGKNHRPHRRCRWYPHRNICGAQRQRGRVVTMEAKVQQQQPCSQRSHSRRCIRPDHRCLWRYRLLGKLLGMDFHAKCPRMVHRQRRQLELKSGCLPHREIRYYSTYNFVGTRIDGYEQPVALMSRQARNSTWAARSTGLETKAIPTTWN